MIFEVLWHAFTGIQTCLDLGMSNVTTHDDGAVQAQACAHRILAQNLAHLAHGLVEVNLHGLALAGIAQFLGNQLIGFIIEFLDPDTIFVNLSLDVAVGRTTDTQTDGARCAMTGQTHHAHVVCHALAAELCAQTDVAGLLKQLLLQFDITEGTTSLVAGCGQTVVVVRAGQLDGE